ncbi:MAG TPA: FAD-dependent oxidoreductase [Bryobacteraceae bacterium]|jgi:glycine/D-amino acid oxidase-like deaminating enzyme
MNRRTFLSAALIGLTAKAERTIQGSYVNESFSTGHKIRDHKGFPSAGETVRIPVVIVGGGVAGLSAAWWLDKKGFRDFVLLEMEPEAGGNSRWGENAITRYPWAAHYVPVPKPESVYVRELFTELGIADAGSWKEEMLCFSLKERLFIEGHWQEGIEPDSVFTRTDREQFRRFADRIGEFRASGAFTIPMELGSLTKNNQAELDTLSFSEWLRREGYSSRYLHWYADYACRDDFGALARDTSAWAGIHYFASRPKEEVGPITAPEGNGWIVRRLLAKLRQYVRTSCPVFRMERSGTGWLVRTPKVNYKVESIIFAAPTFLAGYMIDGISRTEHFVYSPWFTANLTLDRMPRELNGAELAWDNVLFHSKSLGYVDATHMSLRTYIDHTVWTYYWSLAEYEPQQARQLLLDRSWNDWKEIILQDLEQAHPDIRQCVARIDMMRLGHAMARPVPGFLQSKERHEWIKGKPEIYFANSDLSGFSIFEEAQYRGIQAAENVLRRHSRG